ncbi:MAG: hypothetical protein QG567_1928 [Campylobacterota bacterium]|nr:hypothetical protein [Campylobacterota bacterium]
MLKKINNCYDEELLHQMGQEISMSMAPDDMKKPLYEAIEKQLNGLSLLMAESSEMSIGDVEMNYRFED